MEVLLGELTSQIGTIVIAAAGGRLLALDYGDCSRRMRAGLEARHGAARFSPSADPFGMSARVRDYFAGDHAAIDGIAVETGGTAFQREVWAALRRVPAGSTITYAAMAAALGRPNAARAVGAANGQNPVSIVIPCHRMVGSDGALTGYAGGLDRKRWLLAHEGAHPGGCIAPERARAMAAAGR